MDPFSFLLWICTMANQVFHSMDLIRHIYSFGPDHREKMARVMESLKHPTAKDLRIDRICIPHVHPRDLLQYVKDTRCRCCSRHSHRKTRPVFLHSGICFAPARERRVPEDMDYDECSCYCRQRSREFIRRILTYSDPL